MTAFLTQVSFYDVSSLHIVNLLATERLSFFSFIAKAILTTSTALVAAEVRKYEVMALLLL